MTRKHSTRLSQEHDEDAEEQHRTASADYPELGDILTDRPDPGRQITVIGTRRTAEAYDAEHDARNGDYNGGEGDLGMYWAEPGEQEWARSHLGPQEEAPPPVFESPVLARLAAIEEARAFYGTLHHATDINGTHVDDAGYAPEHGTIPRAADPDSYDDESQEGTGDDRWNQALPKSQHGDKENENGATVGMFPEGISSGNGPGLPIGAFTASTEDDLAHHMEEGHGTQPGWAERFLTHGGDLSGYHSRLHHIKLQDHSHHPDVDWAYEDDAARSPGFIASLEIEARVPWTGAERGTLHSWHNVPTATWGDFVNSAEFPLLAPGEHVIRDEAVEPMTAEAALDLPHQHDDDYSEIDQGGVEGDDGFPRLHRDAALNVHVRIDGKELEHGHDDGPDPQPQPHEHDDPDNSLDNSRTTPDNPPDKNGPEITSGQASGGGLPDSPPVTPPGGRTNPDDPGLSPDDPGHPDNWPQAGADVSETSRAYTQGSGDGKVKRGAPAPGPFSPGDGDSGGGGDQGDDKDDGDQPDDEDTPFSRDASLAMFTAAAGSPSFRFEFTASWGDVVAKARRIREQGHVRIVHASAGMVIGEVRGDHDTYESGIQRAVGKRHSIQHWACGCPWASFHQKTAARKGYNGRPCSHVMALQFEAQSRGMFGRSFDADAAVPHWSPQTVVVKSMPPYEGDPHAGQWREQWRAPVAHRLAHREGQEGWPYIPPVAPRDLAQHIIGHHGLTPDTVARALTRMGDPEKGGIWARTWHDAEHRARAVLPFNHQHDAPSGLAGEARWPAAFRPEHGFSLDEYGGTPHRDFPGAGGSAPLEPLPPHWSSIAPAERATVALLRAGTDPGAVGALRVMAGMRATADQANSSWGSQNVSEHPTQKPYGATSPPNLDMDPGSYGFLAGPDPDNWGGIQDNSAMQMPLTNTAAHQVLVPGAPRPVPGDLHWPAVEGWQPEDQGTFGYTDHANTAGPSTAMNARDPNGIRMEEALAAGTPFPYRDAVPQLDGALAELHDHPEPALPETTGDDIEAAAAADGTIGGGDAGTGQGQGAAEDTAALGEFGAARRMYLHHLAGTPMGDLGRETSPQAQQPSPVGQEPGMGSGDDYLSPDDTSIQTIGNQQWSGGGADSDEVAVPAGQPQGQIDDIVASFQRSAAARGYAGDSRPSVADGDIAAAARAHLSKTADALPQAEADELIREGAGSRARNLDLLRLEGTHYEDADEDLGKRGVSLDEYDDDVMFA